jgi:protein-S-isoprenylcysteine O-methyltransferase Ste14
MVWFMGGRSSALSERSQKAFFTAFFSHMALLAVASGISILNSPDPEVAIAQAIVLLGALGCAIFLFWGKPDRHWYSGRAVAESIKTITWRYISRAEPFNNDNDIDFHNFKLKIRAILDQNKDVAGLLNTHLDGLQITSKMTDARARSIEDRIQNYHSNRIAEQQIWYAKKAAANKRKVTIYFSALVLLIVLSIVFSVSKIAYPKVAYWPTDFLVTVAAGLLSWIQAKRYQELAVSYSLTAHEISMIRQQTSQSMTEKDFSDFVGDAENAFSREHTQWVARKDQK